jgi:DNA-3-methyladenine glycosylase
METEAYRGDDDPASHAYKGQTKRTSLMFGAAGYTYVYLIYGMYHCLNITCEQVGKPAAVLIRGVKLIKPMAKILDGPGKICRELKIDMSYNGLNLGSVNLIKGNNFYITEQKIAHELVIKHTPRIGIKKGLEHLWRYVMMP